MLRRLALIAVPLGLLAALALAPQVRGQGQGTGANAFELSLIHISEPTRPY